MDVDKLQARRADRPPPPRLNPHPNRSVRPPSLSVESSLDLQVNGRMLAEMDLDYVFAMDDRVRQIVSVLREKRSCLILDPERLEAQEEEAAAELYAVLQEVSRCKSVEGDLLRAHERAKDDAYNRELERAQLLRDQWKAWEDWLKRRGPLWDAIKAWEKERDVYERYVKGSQAKNITTTRKAEIDSWLAANPLRSKPPEPKAPPKPEGPMVEAEVKVTDVKKSAAVGEVVDATYNAYVRAQNQRRQAEDYAQALQQKLALISGMQGARNRGI